MMWIEVIIDGNSQTMLYYCGDNLLEGGQTLTGLSGSQLTIRITAGNQASDEIYTIDDIFVNGIPSGSVSTSISVSPSTTICEGSSVTLTAQGPGPYSWSNGANTQSITVSPTTQTNYTVTTGTGCGQSSANQVITVFQNPTANAGSNQTICAGESAALTASGGNNYQWSNGQLGPTISVSPTSTTIYNVTVSQAGCSDVDSVTVTVDDPPDVSASTDQMICAGASVTLTASGADSYSWSNGMSGSSITFTPNSSILLTVTGTTENCTDSDQVNVTVNTIPSANILGNNAICAGESTTLTAQGIGSYSWSTGESGNSINVSPSSNTTYSLTVSNNGCQDTASFEVQVAASPIADAGEDVTICDGGQVTLSASGGSTYQWSNGDASQSTSIDVNSSTTFAVTVTSDNCSDVDSVESFMMIFDSWLFERSLHRKCVGVSFFLM